MTKTDIESAIARAKACASSSDRAAVLANLEAFHRHLRLQAGEKLTGDEVKLPAVATYTRVVDIETDLRVLEAREGK